MELIYLLRGDRLCRVVSFTTHLYINLMSSSSALRADSYMYAITKTTDFKVEAVRLEINIHDRKI